MNNNNKRVNFFLVGAPKCGTTTIYELLRDHPEVFLPAEKELHYFARDIYPDDYLTEEQYKNLFNATSEEKVLGEASVWYLYSEEAVKRIKEYNKDSKILIMLRNPVDMLRSLHSQYVFDNMENYVDFEMALSAEQERKKGNNIPSNVYDKRLLIYSELGRYSKYVERYIDTFGKNNVFIIFHEDFAIKPKEVYEELLGFLNISPAITPEFKRYNANKVARSKLLGKLISPSKKIKSFGRKIIPFQVRRKLLILLTKINTKHVSPDAINDNLRARLSGDFIDDIEKLEMLTGKDLASWKKV